ncbi:MAG: histidine phosphatase family protein [Acidobacteriota bacterium]
MKLYFVRHGETRENVENIIQGHQPGTLTAQGHEQAQRLAARLAEIDFTAIYASDLGRVVDTARYVTARQAAPLRFDERLRERGAGIYEGLPRQVLWDAEASSGEPQIEFRPEGGESFLDLQARIDSFVETALDRHAGQSVLVLSHGGWNRQLLGRARQLSVAESLDLPQINTCVNIIEIDAARRFTIHLANCVSHLEPLAK